MVTENEISNEDLLELERSLKSYLHPIKPDQSFVWTLRNRLDQNEVLEKQDRLAVSMLTIAGGLVIGLIIFLIGQFFIQGED